MKRVHNIRFTAFARTQEERSALAEALVRWLGEDVRPSLSHEDLREPGYDTIFALTLRLDRQPLVRRALAQLRDGLSAEDVRLLRDEAPLRVDGRGRFFFRLDAQALLRGKLALAERGSVVQVRVNIAAFPNRKEDPVRIARGLLE